MMSVILCITNLSKAVLQIYFSVFSYLVSISVLFSLFMCLDDI